jgi:hypothetical protein
MWGRLIGAVFYIPAGVMWAKGMFTPALKKRVVGMGCLLAFQVIVFLLPRIRDILVRIRIRGSVPLTNGSGSGSCYFRPRPSIKTPTKFIFFCLFLFEGT